MSNKNYSFENKEVDRRPILNRINCKPISNIIPFNKIPKDNLKQKPLKILNGKLNKNNNEPSNLFSSNNLETETRKNLRNSTSNAKIYNNIQEELKRTFFSIEDCIKTAKAEKAYFEFPNYNELSKNNKEAIDMLESYTNQNLNNNKQNKVLPEDQNFNEKSMHLLNNIPKYNNSLAQKNNKDFITKNLSMNSKINNYSVNYLPIQSQNNSCFNNISLLTSSNKHSFNNSNIIGAVNCRLNSKPANSTFLKGGFIMSGLEKKKNNEEKNNINITGKQSFLNPKGDLMIKKNNNIIDNTNIEEKSEFNKNTISIPKDLNENSNKIKKINQSKKQNINNFNNSNQMFSFVNNKNFNLFQNHRRNDSIYLLTDFQKQNKQNLEVCKNRSNSFNSLKIKSYSNATKIRRPKSLNLKQIINDYNIKTDFDSHYTSIENKKTIETSQSNFKNIFNEAKTFSVLDLKKRYNDVIKKKNIPTSMLIKSIKSNVYYKQNNKTISHPENNLNDFGTIRKSIINPSTSINSFQNLKETYNRNNKENICGVQISNLKSIKTNRDFLNEIINNSETIPQKNISSKNSNLIVKDKNEINDEKKKSNSKDKIISNNFNNISELLLNNNINKYNEKKKQMKNSEDKDKVLIKYGLNNEDKLTKNLYKPKRSNTNNINMHSKNGSKCNILLRKHFETFDFYPENTLENRNFNKYEIPTNKEDFNLKRLRLKNKSFGSMKFNWNNLIFSSKSNKLVKNKINKTNKRNNIDKTDSQLKSELQANLESAFLKLIFKKDLQNNNSSEINNLQKNKGCFKASKNIPSIKTNIIMKNKSIISEIENNNAINTNSFKEKTHNTKEICSNSIKNNLLKSDLIESIINFAKNQKEEINIPKNSFIDASKIVEYNNSKVKDDVKDKKIFNFEEKLKLDLKNLNNKVRIFESQNNYNQRQRLFQTDNDKNISNQFINFEILDLNSIKGNNEYNPNENNNIKILENLSYHNLNDLSSYNIITNTDPNEILITKNNYYQEEEIQSELSTPKMLNKTNKDHKEKQNNNQIQFSLKNKENKNEINGLISYNKNDYYLESKESFEKLNKINKSFSICSQYADDIEDMNTIIKRLSFIKNHKNEENIFKIDNKVYIDFEVKFKNDIENHLFPK